MLKQVQHDDDGLFAVRSKLNRNRVTFAKANFARIIAKDSGSRRGAEEAEVARMFAGPLACLRSEAGHSAQSGSMQDGFAARPSLCGLCFLCASA
jgi:hypothetical protein